jgi:4-hydroxy-3-polyprenylbenzoate decarboxylase
LEESKGIKMILYVEHTVDANDLTTALWRICNNLDPKRDHILFQRSLEVSHMEGDLEGASCIGFDGTRKTKTHDNFQRDWPNIIVADDVTIKAVDAKWDQLGLGEFIPSPSLKFKAQMYGEEAVVE